LEGFGGGIANEGMLTVSNCTFNGNSSQGEGGALSNGGNGVATAVATILACTISGNTADLGGGIANFDTLTLRSVIVAGNTEGTGGQGPDVFGAVRSASGFNLVGDGTGMTGISNGVNNNLVGSASAPIDPRLGPLADNGGPTQTMALLADSPAIDRGDPGLPAIDQRGVSRDFHQPDIGAFEFLGTPTPTPSPSPTIFAVGADAGAAPLVNVYDAQTGALLSSFAAFDLPFRGGVRVAVARLNGQDVVIAGAGPGGFPLVSVFDASGHLLSSFFAFAPAFHGGVYVAAGDLHGDGGLEVVVGAGPEADAVPVVGVFTPAGGVLGGFFAFDPAFKGGVRVALADVNGSGRDDIVAAAGPGGAPLVGVWDGLTLQLAEPMFLAFGLGYSGGVSVAAGRLDSSGVDRLVFGTGPTSVPEVVITDGVGTVFNVNHQPFRPVYQQGVNVAVANVLGQEAVLVGAGSAGQAAALTPSLDLLAALPEPFPGFAGGLFVA
jgi:hypothetical protein